MGSERFGDLLLREPLVETVVSGHCHRRQDTRVGHLRALSLGCTYYSKEYQTIVL